MVTDSYVMALSLWQPWAHAVCHLGKRIENRDRWHEGMPQLAEARRLIGRPILIHAAKGCGTRGDFDDAVRAIVAVMAPHFGDEGSLVRPFAFVDSAARCGPRWCPAPSLPRMVIVARATLADVVITSAFGHRWAAAVDAPRCLLCGAACAPGHVRLPAPPATPTCPKSDPWAQMGVGLVLADVVPLAAPVSYPGRQGWFRVPASELS